MVQGATNIFLKISHQLYFYDNYLKATNVVSVLQSTSTSTQLTVNGEEERKEIPSNLTLILCQISSTKCKINEY